MPKIASDPSTSLARQKPQRFHFTLKALEALPNPTNGQRAYYYDSKVRGLAIAVSPLGRKTFILYRYVAGRPERITIGPLADLSIDQARRKAEELNAAIAQGQNPAESKRAIRDEATLQELFDTYLENHSKLHKRSWKADVDMFKYYLGSLRLRKLSAIRRVDVINLHARIGRKAPYAANRVMELLRSMFNRATEWGWHGENPAAKIRAFHETKRERFMDGGELKSFFEALAAEPNVTIRDCILLSLLTGARRGNVQSMRWDEIDWHQATWTIPARKAKEEKIIRVVLTPAALSILETRKLTSSSVWVFPSSASRSGHLEEPKVAWSQLLKRANISNLRMHDLRRTLGSWQAATGASLPIIGKSLGHESLAATAVYARLNLDPIRASVNKATSAMLLAGGAKALLGDGK